MKFKLRVRGIIEFGKRTDEDGHPHQEDSMYPSMDAISDSCRVFVLCDGMGGHDKGEVASETVAETMGKVVETESSPEGSFSDLILQHAISEAYKALDAKDSGATKKMGTTMTFLKFHDAGYTAAHLGDSRIYQFRPGDTPAETKIIFKSEDHSLVNDLIKVGQLTEEEAKTFPQKNVITRAMQPNDERRSKADVHHSSNIMPGDYFYLCTDGMLEEADDENLKFFFSDSPAVDNIDKKVQALRMATIENRDNHTAFIIEVVAIEGRPATPVEADSKECPLLIDKDMLASRRSAASQIVSEVNHKGRTSENPIKSKSEPAYSSSINMAPPLPGKKKRKSKVLIYILSAILALLLMVIAYLFIEKINGEGRGKDIGKRVYEDEEVDVVKTTESEVSVLDEGGVNISPIPEELSKEKSSERSSSAPSKKSKQDKAQKLPAKNTPGTIKAPQAEGVPKQPNGAGAPQKSTSQAPGAEHSGKSTGNDKTPE